MYPGTREDTLQYSISTSPSPLSRRQTGQQPLPVTDLTTPTSGSAEVALSPGTYSVTVTVTVTNEHGSATAVPQQVTIVGWLLQSSASPPLVLLCYSTCILCVQCLLQFRFSCVVRLARASLLSTMMGWSSRPDYLMLVVSVCMCH